MKALDAWLAEPAKAHEICVRYTRNYERAEELRADVAYRLLRKDVTADDDRSPWGLMYTIARNLFLDRRRHDQYASATIPFSIDTKVEDSELTGHNMFEGRPAEKPEIQAERKQQLERVLDAIEVLPGYQQLVLYAIFFEGLKYQDVADRFGLPIGTVRSRYARAKKALSKMLGDLA